MKPQIPWLRVFVEGVVIVGSILLAFGIDAWWEERGDRMAEREALTRLQAEFTENRARINDGTMQLPNRLLTLYEQMRALPGAAGTLTVSDSILRAIILVPTFDPVTPVLDGLVRSGRFEIIQDPRVRDAISGWERWLAQVAEVESEGRVFTYQQLRPALATRGDVAEVFAQGLYFGGIPGADLLGETTLRVDPELQAHIATRLGFAAAAAELRGRLRASADSVLAALTSTQGG